MKKLFATLMGALLASLTILSVPMSVYAAEFDRKTLEGVVYIYWEGIVKRYDNEGYPYADYVGISGSGFFVGKEGTNSQYIVTNYHVVEDHANVDSVTKEYADALKEYLDTHKNAKSHFPLYVCYNSNDFEEAYIVDFDKEKDIAILKISSPTDKRSPLKLKQSSDVSVGETVWAIGYPGVSDELADSVTSFGINDATVTVGSINRIITQTGTGTKLYQTDAKLRSGNSGGPLVDKDRCVLGINTSKAIDAYDSNLNYAVSIDELLPMLAKNNIPYTIYNDSFFSKYQLFIVIGAGALVIVLAAIAIIVSRQSKVKKPAMAGVGAPLSPAAVAAGAIGTDVGSRAAKPIVRSMSEQHAGMTVNLDGQPLLIGRDVSACRIVFREGTPGVSSKHCQISFDERENVFVLVDLKSSYGTFLANGQRLSPNIPYTLKQRDSFYLGERDNSLYVDLG